jgi:transcriptional regulator with XRE-family HTH domain
LPTSKQKPGGGISQERSDLAARLRFLVKRIGTQAEAAKVAGVTPQQLRNLISGKSAPSLQPVANMALHGGVSLDWVVTGQGSPDRRWGLERAVAAVEGMRPVFALQRELSHVLGRVYGDAGLPMSEDDELDVVGSAIDAVMESGLGPEHWAGLVDAVVASHRAAIQYIIARLRRDQG